MARERQAWRLFVAAAAAAQAARKATRAALQVDEMAELKRILKDAARAAAAQKALAVVEQAREAEGPTEAEEAWAAADDERPQDSQTIS